MTDSRKMVYSLHNPLKQRREYSELSAVLRMIPHEANKKPVVTSIIDVRVTVWFNTGCFI